MKLGPLEDSYPDWKDSPYFCDGGVSIVGWRNPIVLPSWMEPTIERVPDPPEPWTCRYCGTLNPGDVWTCGRCPAPRQETSREERSMWLPPVRVVSHEEPATTSGLDWVIHHPNGGVLRDKSSPPWWAVLLALALALSAFFTLLLGVRGVLYNDSFIAGLSWLLVSFVCCILWKSVIEPMYDWEAKS